MRHYANPGETTFVGSLFVFHFGAYGDTEVAVYQRPGCLDDALETAAEWLKDNAPGLFTEPDYDGAAREVGVDLSQYTRGLTDIIEADEDLGIRICQVAEADLTYTESGWLASWEWTVDEIEDDLPSPHFDRFDIAEAYAAYWAAYHMGQNSHGYARLCASQRILTNNASDLQFDKLSENGQAIYRRLVLADGR